jgi:hypothetical protein
MKEIMKAFIGMPWWLIVLCFLVAGIILFVLFSVEAAVLLGAFVLVGLSHATFWKCFGLSILINFLVTYLRSIFHRG